MKIDTKGQFDAEVCESIPLNYTNLLQGYGYLLVTDFDLNILQWSANLPAFLKLNSNDFTERNFKNFLIESHIEEIRNKIENKKVQGHIPVDLIFKAKTEVHFKALLHIKEKYLLFELEENHFDKAIPFTKLYQEIKYFSAVLKIAESMEEVCQQATENLRALSGFDRVMIYRFDKEWNGQVLGEDAINGQEYLGLHFPSSDIPKQARQLYLKNPYRMIPDIHSGVQALVPEVNSAIGGLTDLSDCNLRSVARVHLEYLNNMGVKASMSVPIIKDQELWGIIACHHMSPKHLPYELRSAFELLASLISELVTTRESNYQLKQRIILFEKLGVLIKFMSQTNDFVSGLLKGEVNILELLKLSGTVVLYEDDYHAFGDTPPRKFVDELINWHKKEHSHHIFVTHELPIIYPPAQEFANMASGVIFLPLSADRKSFIIGFRQEYIQTIKWAGEPSYSKRLSNDLAALHPRNSFDLYNETKRYNSVKWNNIEVEIANNLLKSILEIILKGQIMKRIIAEEELFKLSIVAQRMGNTVVTLNHNGQIEWVNKSFTDYSGLKLNDVVGKTLFEILESSEYSEDGTEFLSQANKEKNGFERDILIRRDGRETYINFNVSRVKNIDKDKEKYIIIGTDVTKIKEKSNALKSINEQLDQYTYIVSHDLKAPLKGIEGLINILEETAVESEQTENTQVFSMIRESISKMDGFISSLLSQAKGNKEELADVDLNILLEEILKWLNPDKTIDMRMQPNMPVIKTNPNTLQQVFSNLISNAIRYGCEKSHPCIIEIGIVEKFENKIRFFVKDNGPGIAKEFHQRIFNLYDTGKENDSTGIGLHTTKSLVEKNNGSIWVESEVGNGAVFIFDWTI